MRYMYHARFNLTLEILFVDRYRRVAGNVVSVLVSISLLRFFSLIAVNIDRSIAVSV